MADSSSEEKVWTPANIVTMLRIGGVPVFVAALLSPWPQWLPIGFDNHLIQPLVAAIIFGVLAATDGVDGYLARSRNEVTTFGKFIDPLADKILVAAALLALVELGVLPSWVALIILSREFIISGLRMIAAAKGEVIAASWYGKAKTVTQIFAILLFLLKDFYVGSNEQALSNPLWIFAWIVMLVAVALTIVSMVDYIYKARGILGFSSKSTRADQGLASDGKDRSNVVVAADVVSLLSEKSLTVATAESLTGGMIAAALTAVPGSSSVVHGGIVSYVNQVKHDLLKVDHATLDSVGPVSEDTAIKMAQSAQQELKTDLAVSVTGIAGPTGAEPGKPVGTVWLGFACPSGVTAKCYQFEGDRDAVRAQTVQAALGTVYFYLKDDNKCDAQQ